MKKFKIEKSLTLSGSAVIGLTAAQAADRLHLLQKADVKGLPQGITAYTLVKPVQFKAGETIYTHELPKNLASQVVEVVEAGADLKKGVK